MGTSVGDLVFQVTAKLAIYLWPSTLKSASIRWFLQHFRQVLPKDGHGFSQAPLIFFLAVCLSPFTPHLLHQGLTAGW
jgi:hypothetical protein